MDPAWLIHNIGMSWRYRASLSDVYRRLLWIYADKVPSILRPREQTIGFKFPQPLGSLRLDLRPNSGSDLFIFSEVFEHEYYRLPLASPPATILDLGANIGLSAVYFSRQFPNARLACVEPMPQNLRLLRANLALNAVPATVFAAAVDVSDGDAVMAIHSMDYGHMIAASGAQPQGPLIDVSAISVPTILRQMDWDRIGLLKIDIEGHEKVLLGGECSWLVRVDAMCIECHEGFGEVDLRILAGRYGFGPPQRLPGTWFMSREASSAHALSPGKADLPQQDSLGSRLL